MRLAPRRAVDARRVLAAAALAVLLGGAAQAQVPGVGKETLQTAPFPGGGRHSVLVRTTVAPGALVPPHTHPGLELGYVQTGEAEVTLAGAPARRVAAGGSFAIPPGTVHSVRSTGSGPLVIVSTYVVDADRPIFAPAKRP